MATVAQKMCSLSKSRGRCTQSVLPLCRSVARQGRSSIFYRSSVDRQRCVGRRHYCQKVQATPEEARQLDPTRSKHLGLYYLDTLSVAKKFQAQGFTAEQAEALTQALSELVNTALEQQTRTLITKPQQEIMVQQLLAQMASIKKDMVILEKSEFTMIRNDTEKQGIVIKQLGEKLDDEIKKLGGLVKLDINLERSRAIEAHALNERELQALVNKIDVQHANDEKHMQGLNNKIDIEISNLRTQIEKNRNDLMKFSMGMSVSIIGVYFAYLRLFS